MTFTFTRWDTRRAAHTGMVFAAWTLAGLILAIQAWMSGDMRDEPVALTHTSAVWLTWAYLWALLTPIALLLVRSFPLAHPHLARAVVIHIVAGLVLTALDLAMFAALAPMIGAVNAESTWAATFRRLLGTAFVLNVPVYGLIIGTACALRVAREANERERRALRLEAQLSEARLLVLRAQLEPHFLFNSLNTVAVLMRENVDAADRVLVLLSGLLRRALDTSATSQVELRHEIAFVESYLALEQVRFADRLSYRLDVDPQLLDARVPSLILQPLVENALRHGLGANKADGRVEVTVERDGGMLRLSVRDNGAGMAANAPHGVGLSNTRSRLELLYGEHHSFDLSPARGGGLMARIGIPLATPGPS